MNESEIGEFTYCAVILWAAEGKLNADVWTFYLKDWKYNTDINVVNFSGLDKEVKPSMVTNGDGFLLLAEIEKLHSEFPDLESFLMQYPDFIE